MAYLPKAFWPLTIAAGSNDKIDFIRGSVKVATVPAGTYPSAALLAAAVQAALNLVDPPGWTVSVGSTGRFVVGFSSPFMLLPVTGANVAQTALPTLGFTTDTSSATTQTGNVQHANGWYGDRSVSFDAKPSFRRHAAQSVALARHVASVSWGESELRRITLALLPPHKTKVDREGAALNEAIERLWRDGFSRFRWWPDASVEGTYTEYALDQSAISDFNPSRLPTKELYTLEWLLRRLV